jgi:hypothetical protein
MFFQDTLNVKEEKGMEQSYQRRPLVLFGLAEGRKQGGASAISFKQILEPLAASLVHSEVRGIKQIRSAVVGFRAIFKLSNGRVATDTLCT